MPNARRLPLLVVGAALVAAACSSPVGPSPSPGTGSPGPDPSANPSSDPPTTGGPSGPKDLVLRMEEGGGMFVDLVLAQAPQFSLYGDGTVVFRDPTIQPPADKNGLLAYLPYRTARLSAEQMEALLDFAVTEGGLGVARARYDDPMTADGTTVTFTISTGGQTKVVEVYSLGYNDQAPDQPIRGQFIKLAQRLAAFDEGGAIPTDEYVPHGWRGVLFESGGVPQLVHEWPWEDIAPTDFVAHDEPNRPTFPSRVLTAEEVQALGLGELRGGLLGYSVKGPDDKIYNLVIRPLLPDEAG